VKAPFGVRPAVVAGSPRHRRRLRRHRTLRVMQLTAASEQVFLGSRLRRCENKTSFEDKGESLFPNPVVVEVVA
jgi:hypothetical protein